MKGTNPFGTILPPGSPLARVAEKRRSHLRVRLFVVVAVGVFGLAVLLIGGCIHARRIKESAVPAKHHELIAAATTNASAPVWLPLIATNSPVPALIVSARPSPPSIAPIAPAKSAPRIAAQATTAKNYSVVKGDTFSKIAKANRVSVSALVKANPDIEPAKLKAGQVLHIPNVGQEQTLPSKQITPAAIKKK